jgi:hypothetical protein
MNTTNFTTFLAQESTTAQKNKKDYTCNTNHNSHKATSTYYKNVLRFYYFIKVEKNTKKKKKKEKEKKKNTYTRFTDTGILLFLFF